MKRNDVVAEKHTDGSWYVPARINRVLSETEVEVVCCGHFFRRMEIAKLENVNYKGRWDTFSDHRKRYPVWYHMPSLRKLKQRAARYNRNVWKQTRRRNPDLELYPFTDIS